MRIGILTSSRADFGIYLPLLKKFLLEPEVSFDLIVFGTHLSAVHGYTKNEILNNGFTIAHEIETLLPGDTAEDIAASMGKTITLFSGFWGRHTKDFDIVLCLGDRYEMFAAVAASIPFVMPVAHIHAGETTLGAIDNAFRHAITHASSLFFTSTELYADKVRRMVDKQPGSDVYNVGALSLDTFEDFEGYAIEEFSEKWHIDLSKPTILTTFHPETVDGGSNKTHAETLCAVINQYAAAGFQFLITMPNADTYANSIRQAFTEKLSDNRNVYMVENLGTKSYFTAMQSCCFLLGNTSSGIIEAASFGKYVINLGNRQAGRAHGLNVIDCAIEKDAIAAVIEKIREKKWTGGNIYYQGGAADQIINVLKAL